VQILLRGFGLFGCKYLEGRFEIIQRILRGREAGSYVRILYRLLGLRHFLQEIYIIRFFVMLKYETRTRFYRQCSDIDDHFGSRLEYNEKYADRT
jgi:hypothetical protein